MRSSSCLGVFALVSFASAAGSALESRDAPTCTNQLKTPAPGGLVCEKTGYVRRPNVIATAAIATQNLCRDYCIGNPSCLSFSYATNNQSCTHYRTGIQNSGFVRTPGGAVFANRRCYKKVCTCPANSTLCNGQCSDFSTDPNNCGKCGTTCPENGTGCSDGVCTCPTGLTLCGGRCVDTSTEDSNCGSCGNQCPVSGEDAAPFCYGGSCYQGFHIGINTGDNPDTFLSFRVPENNTVPQYAVTEQTDASDADRFIFTGGTGVASGQLICIDAFKSGWNKFITSPNYNNGRYPHETFFGRPLPLSRQIEPLICELDDVSNRFNCIFYDGGSALVTCSDSSIPDQVFIYSAVDSLPDGCTTFDLYQVSE